MLLHDTFKLYEDTNVPITVEQVGLRVEPSWVGPLAA